MSDKELKGVQGEFFRTVYKLLIDKERGPRLYLFLYAIEADQYVGLLDFSYPQTEAECEACKPAEEVVEEVVEEVREADPVEPVKPEVTIDETEPDYVRSFGAEGISDMMTKCRDKGFFVTYNHPTWSLEDYTDYMGYKGMHAFEMFNGGCNAVGYDDYNPRVYDDILRSGNKIFCIGADDNHNGAPDSSRRSDSGWAWTTIKADKLDYATITKALLDGSFYASEGPEIYDLWYEDGKIHIRCSAADRICCNYKSRNAEMAIAENGVLVSEASFNFPKERGYARITVIDEKGRKACTNAYFAEDICD
jgi:hypothetical protein